MSKISMNSPAPQPNQRNVKGVILVGGPSRGTRFRPLSMAQTSVPKPLFPIAGFPMIRHHINALVDLNQCQISSILQSMYI
jgi:NDP-sugar pyrophosphorylase family protein